MSSKITTPIEWWAELDNNWLALFSIMDNLLDLTAPATLSLFQSPLLTPTVFIHENKVYKFPGPLHVESAAPALIGLDGLPVKIYHDLIGAKENRDWKRLTLYLRDAWHVVLGKSCVHQLSEWKVLYNLCAESWVFHP